MFFYTCFNFYVVSYYDPNIVQIETENKLIIIIINQNKPKGFKVLY